MRKELFPEFVLIMAPGILLSEEDRNRLFAAMDQFGLDSACPLHPSYHRNRGRFECNLMYRYRTSGIELHGYCLAVRQSVWNKLPTLDLHNYRWLEQYRQQVVGLGLEHGLVCNALVYEAKA